MSLSIVDRSLVVDGARLAIRDRGEGPAVVLIHGTPSHSMIWRDVAPALEQAGWRTVAYDLLGYGRSERPRQRDTSVTGQAALLAGLLDALELPRVCLVGHDIGGAVAMAFATRWPARVDRLGLISSVSYDSWPSASWRSIIESHLDDYLRLSGSAFEDMLARQLHMTTAATNGLAADVLEGYLEPNRGVVGRVSFFEHQVRHYDSVHTLRTAPLLPDLAVPTLVLWGAEDRWQPVDYARRLVADIPGAQLRVIDRAGHFAMEDRPEEVVAALHSFLDPGGS